MVRFDVAGHEASTRFYTKALGWGTRVDRPLMGIEGRPPYTMWTAGDAPIAGMVPFSEAYWLGYVAVADVGRSATQVKDLGGQVINGPMEVPGGDWIAQCVDPVGGMFAVHQTAR